ncbi:heavy metal translocating P-type ATPase [Arthrobacter sp. SLBN-122]|uniref:heavy metal translocating P-type ATPase n=1 Tax=Arthrobacter sp. SLBN-122 TaxID=2768455 RepID=UPI00114FC925|nr:heavy metal translocating P-type ATPase [Arthrobacter sp. SLBN-122]TQJ34486.1 Cu+-exporting ATPase [Arthrobacter sp. SLBN-122]
MSHQELLHQPGTRIVELDIEGMTCASCVNRVEKKLGKLDGVSATVNLPLESAYVTVPEGISDEQLVDTVNAAGYTASVRAPRRPAGDAGDLRQHASKRGTSEHAEQVSGVAAQLRPRLILAAVLTIPVFLVSMVPAFQFPNWGWAAAVLALPVVTWAAWPFHRAAAINARHLASTMDTLVSLGVAAAYLFSAWQLLADPRMTEHPGMEGMPGGLYFEVASVVTTFLLLGRYLEANAKQKAGDALQALLNLGAKDATVLRGGLEEKIPADRLQVGDVLVVRPGEKIATDGVVVDGASAVDASLVTGESVPVEVGPDSRVTGATINTSGRLLVRATRVGSETTLAQMARLVSQAQTGKAPIARLADRISAVFVPVVLAIAALTFVLWLVLAGPGADGSTLREAFTAAVAVLVIACPCALGLATPVGLLTGTGRGAQLGILIKGPQVLEDTRTVDTILLDKTGTVTTGVLAVDATAAFPGFQEGDVLRLAGAVEAASEHPVARAIAAAAASAASLALAAHEGGASPSAHLPAAHLPAVQGFSSAAGGGVSGTVEGRHVMAGRSGWLEQNGIALDAGQQAQLAAAEDGGATAICVAVDGTPAGIISLRDTVKEGSAAAVARLKALGLRPILLTGDNAAVAARVAAAVGIAPDDVHSGILPEGKVEAVRKLQAGGATVAMAGDGVNDAAALAQADLGIAMGSGTDVAIEAADLTVMGNDLAQVAQAIELSRKTLGTIKTNLFWAFFYNAVGIPVAALGLLNPMIAGGAMAASSVLVVANSLRLRSFGKPRR